MTDWPQIVEQHGPLVWRTAYRLLGNEPDAADCFQRAFVAAVELASSETVRNWPALLRRLATARALDRLRQRGRDAKRFERLPETGRVDGKAIDPHRAAEANELAAHLRDALSELDATQGQVFCLASLEGLSYQEIADQVGITVNHVGVLLNRARATLRERLRAHQRAPAAEGFRKEVSHE